MPLDLDDPTAVALAIFQAFSTRRLEAALYGGLALAAYGEPRETRDADFAVAGLGGATAAAALTDLGVRPVVALDRARFGGLLITQVTLAEGGGRTGLNMLDLVEPRSTRFAEAALGRAVSGSLRGTTIRVLSPEDFVLFKLLSTRDRDLEDAASLLRAPDLSLDRSLIDAEAARLAIEISDCDVAARLAPARRGVIPGTALIRSTRRSCAHCRGRGQPASPPLEIGSHDPTLTNGFVPRSGHDATRTRRSA